MKIHRIVNIKIFPKIYPTIVIWGCNVYVLLNIENCIILKKIIKYKIAKPRMEKWHCNFMIQIKFRKFTLKLAVLLDGCIFMHFAIYDFEIGWFHFYILGLANVLVLNIYFKVNNKVYIFLVSCRMYSRQWRKCVWGGSTIETRKFQLFCRSDIICLAAKSVKYLNMPFLRHVYSPWIFFVCSNSLCVLFFKRDFFSGCFRGQ